MQSNTSKRKQSRTNISKCKQIAMECAEHISKRKQIAMECKENISANASKLQWNAKKI